MTQSEPFILYNTDLEDIQDVLVMLESSFGIKYQKDCFKHVKTFGDICDIIEQQLAYEHENGCTTQQAFYKLRNALSGLPDINGSQLTPSSRLEDIFPAKGRRSRVTLFERNLGFKVKLLEPKSWIVIIAAIGFLISLIYLAVNWKISLIGITVSLALIRTANYFAKELRLETVGQLAEQLQQEHYSNSRRRPGTFNKDEVFTVIQDLFSNKLDIDKEHLNRDSPLKLS